MRSQEFQVQEGDCGDYWGCGGAFADIPAEKKAHNKFVFAVGKPLLTFRDKGANGRNCTKHPDAENPTGEWNTLDLYCFGDTSVHVVNGKVVMVLYNLREPVGQGDRPLLKGKIQLQSEGAEIFYRKIEVDEIRQLPKSLIN
jgi:hypothetical protein